jgi:hypothetical protein
MSMLDGKEETATRVLERALLIRIGKFSNPSQRKRAQISPREDASSGERLVDVSGQRINCLLHHLAPHAHGS